MVVTINPEMIVHATRDLLYKTILHSAEVHIIDGFGIKMVARLKGAPCVDRFPGVDAVQQLCELAARQGSRVFLLGTGDSTTLLAAANKLKKKNSALKIVGTHKGTIVQENRRGVCVVKEEHQELINRINEVKPDVLLVAFGHGKQEKWIWQFKKQLPTVRLFMGVGGTFDFLAGRVRRAPKFIQKIGLEWLWRLFRQPWRARRVWTATVVFLWKAFR